MAERSVGTEEAGQCRRREGTSGESDGEREQAHGSGRRPSTPEMSRNSGLSSHAQAKGTTCMVAVARASTGLTTHRPASARVRAWCHRSRDPSAGRAREPVCESHDSTGEPGAGDRPAGFGERGEETCSRESDCGPVAKAPDEPPIPTGYAPPLDSTGTVVTRSGSRTTANWSGS